MRKTFLFAVLAAAAALPALAGDDCPLAGKAAADACSGFTCSNMCPLAQQANAHRSTGREGLTLAPTVRSTIAASVQRALARV